MLLKSYTSIKELIKVVKEMLPNNKRIVDGWQENKYFVLEIGTEGGDKSLCFKLKVLMPQ